MSDKVIVTNWTALKKKYGSKVSEIDAAIKTMIAADKARGLDSILIRIDNAADMKKVGGKAVISAGNQKQNKNAFDKIDETLSPDYILILGATDVIPHQGLNNPVYEEGGEDDDKYAYSDLPYACDAAYSKDIADFIGPTRVVGRLPNITGDTKPAYLASLIRSAASWESSAPEKYLNGFGVSTDEWKNSTTLSLKNLFGSKAKPALSPKEGPKWTAAALSRRSHFINCHGSLGDPFFYGQKGDDFPIAHDASFVDAKIAPGTVAAMECCYGAELYEPDSGVHPGIANTYLKSGAYGYLGSTTIAYGPAKGNGSADLICQYFLKSVFDGASLGRAALEARQKFASQSAELDPVDLKTLAQFVLLGDPSIHPVKSASASMLKTRGLIDDRAERRRALFSKGVMIAHNQPVARRVDVKSTPKLQSSLLKLASTQMSNPKLMTFEVDRRSSGLRSALMKGRMGEKSPSSVHVVIGRAKDKPADAHIRPVVAIVAKTVDSKIVSVRELYGK